MDEALHALRQTFDSILIVGHSMGGLMAIRAAVENGEQIERIVALALPLYIRLTRRTLRIRVRSLGRPKASDAPEVQAARALGGVSGLTLLNSVRLLPNTLGLLAVMRDTRPLVSQLTVPLTVIHSTGDELVSDRSLSYVKAHLPDAETVVLHAASHFYYPPSDRARIQEAVRAHLKP